MFLLGFGIRAPAWIKIFLNKNENENRIIIVMSNKVNSFRNLLAGRNENEIGYGLKSNQSVVLSNEKNWKWKSNYRDSKIQISSIRFQLSEK